MGEKHARIGRPPERTREGRRHGHDGVRVRLRARASAADVERARRAWQPFIDTCIELFGTKRCMFESNFPVDKQSCSYVELWNAFKLATRALSTGERSDLFYRTACRTYRLPELMRVGDS